MRGICAKLQNMKIFKVIIPLAFYLIALGRMAFTFMLVFFGIELYSGFESISIIIGLLALDGKHMLLYMILLSLILGLWIMIILSSLIGIKSRKARYISVFSIIFLAVLDCVLPIIHSATKISIYSAITSVAVIALGVLYLLLLKKQGWEFNARIKRIPTVIVRIVVVAIPVVVISLATVFIVMLSKVYVAPYDRMESELNAYAEVLKNEGLATSDSYRIYGVTEGVYSVSARGTIWFECQNVNFTLELFEFNSEYSVNLKIRNFDFTRANKAQRKTIAKVLEITNRFYNTDAFSKENLEKNYCGEYLESKFESIKYEDYYFKSYKEELASYKSTVYKEPYSNDGKCSYTYVAKEAFNKIRVFEFVISYNMVVDDEFLESAYEVSDYEG